MLCRLWKRLGEYIVVYDEMQADLPQDFKQAAGPIVNELRSNLFHDYDRTCPK